MSEIQVSTSDLRDGSQTLNGASNEIGDEQGKLSSIPGSVGDAYDGQLRQALESVVAGSDQTAARLQNRSFDLGDELFSRATGFEAANEAGRSAVLGVSTEYIDFIQTTRPLGFLSFLDKLKEKAAKFWDMGGVPIGGLLTWIFICTKPTNTERKVDSEQFAKPQSPIGEYTKTTPFGEYSGKNGLVGLHNGIDIVPKVYDINKDFPIHPIGPGKVYRVGTEKEGNKIVGYGNYVVIKHTLPDDTIIYSRYAHMKQPSTLTKEVDVDTETQLGNMGDSGLARGQHVHLEVYKEGAYSSFNFKNPDDIFDPKDPKSLTFLEKMKQQFYDPEPFINGTTDIRFTKPTKG